RSAESGDVALLKVEASDLPAVLVSDVNELEIGTPLLSVGYPGLTEGAVDESLEPTNKDGKVSAKKTQGSYPVYEVSAAIASGMSGGPTVNMEGEVIGVNSFGIGDSEAFNFIVPAGNVREILARNGIKNELGRIDTIYREGLTSFYAGRYTPAIEAFDRVLDLDPGHQQAQEYRKDAAKERAEGGEVGDSKFPVVPVAIGAVVVLGLIGAAVVMKGRKKPQGELPAAGATSGPAYQAPPAGPSYDAPQSPAPTPTPVPPAPVAAPSTSQTPADSPSPVSPPPPAPTAQSSDAADTSGDSATKPKFCPSCGTARATETTQFCGSCGTKF
ncbi:MAG TPA: trypsin-like peptidase domain-containing protein, partial [Acidimicrobiales bacterium]|nr:trypsin-like peptidase domain-containing protein [Acidimicrobiales bacterium]